MVSLSSIHQTSTHEEKSVDSSIRSTNSSFTRSKRKMESDSNNSVGNGVKQKKINKKNGHVKKQKLTKNNSQHSDHTSDNIENGSNNSSEQSKKVRQKLDTINEEDVSDFSMKLLEMSLDSEEDIVELPSQKKLMKKGKHIEDLEVKSVNKGNTQASEAIGLGIRRSHRQRHAPLKYWSNERLQYRYTKNGDIECLGIVRDSKGDQLIYDKVTKKKKMPIEKIVKPRKPAQPARSFVENGILVFDPEYKEDVYANVVMPFNHLEWRAPKGCAVGKKFSIGKSFMLDNAAFGFLRLAPMQAKPMQYLPGYDAVFVVMVGKVEVTIHHTPVMLSEKDTFYLPRGNAYSVNNLLDSEALLSFVATHDSFLNELRKGE